MLTRDVRLEGFTTADWVRLIELVRPPRGRPRERDTADEADGLEAGARADRRHGGVIAITTGNRLRKLLGTDAGRLDVRAQAWPVPLEDLATEHSARWAVSLHTGALDELMDRFGDRLRREHDLMAQGLLLVSILRELESEGALTAWPWKLSAWPVPHERMLLRAFEAFCPDGRSLLLGAFENGEVATSIAVRRHGTGFDLILGPDEIRREMGLISGDWTRDYRHLARAAEQRVGSLALGCFGEVSTFRRLAERPVPGAWAAAVAARDIILSPVVPAIAIPLGVDVGRAALATVRDLADRFGASGWLGEHSPLSPALARVKDIGLFDRDIESLLGFDPVVLLRKLLTRDTED